MGTDSCLLYRSSPCSWLQSDNVKCNNSQLEIQLYHQYEAGCLISWARWQNIWANLPVRFYNFSELHSGC